LRVIAAVRKSASVRGWGTIFALALSLALIGFPFAQTAEASHQATYLQVEPETDIGRNGTVHVFTADFRDEANAPIQLAEEQLIDFEIISGPNANLVPGFRDLECPSNNPTQGATCKATYQDGSAFDPNNSTDLICAWISTDGDDDQYDPNGTAADGGDCDAELPREADWNDLTETVLKTWVSPQATFLDVEPETSTSPANTTPTFTVTISDQTGRPIDVAEEQLIDAEVISGPNTNLTPGFRDFECPSNNPSQGGTCTAAYTDGPSFDAAGAADVICFWLSTDGDDDQYDPNGSAADGGDCDVEATDETDQGTDPYGHTIEGEKGNDLTDKVTSSWTVQKLVHTRSLSLSFAHKKGDLVVSGVLSPNDSYVDCSISQPVKVQRRIDGKWDTKATLQSDAEGRYRAELADHTGVYRAVATETIADDLDPSKRHVCAAVKTKKEHSH
jgi:hypothetical protein